MLYASGHEPTKALAGHALRKLDLPIEAMHSTMGRTAARTFETKIIADQMTDCLDALMANIRAGDVAVQNAAKWEPRTGRRKHGASAPRKRRGEASPIGS